MEINKRSITASLAVLAWLAAAPSQAGNPETVAEPFVLAPPLSWGGPYLGLHGGMMQTDAAGIFDEGGIAPHATFGSRALTDFHGGFQGGYNFSDGPLVFGIEGDYSHSPGSTTWVDGAGDAQSLDSEYLATLRGRFGAATDDTLIYLTGGIGFTRTSLEVENGAGELSFDTSGLVYGVGIERRVAPRVTLKGEYLRLIMNEDFPSTEQGGAGALDALPDGDNDDHLSLAGLGVFRLGVNIALGPHDSASSVHGFGDASRVADFSGFYSGVHLGYQHAGAGGQFDSVGAGPHANFASYDLDAAEGGIQVGYNIQRGSIVYGIEGGYSRFDASDSFVDGDGDLQRLSLDHYATLRGRLGIVANDLLVYGTAGLAYGEIDLTVENGTGALSLDDLGLAIGGGVEWALNDKFSIKAEYMRVDLKAHTGSGGGPSAINSLPDGNGDDSLTFSGHDVVRFGAVMHF